MSELTSPATPQDEYFYQLLDACHDKHILDLVHQYEIIASNLGHDFNASPTRLELERKIKDNPRIPCDQLIPDLMLLAQELAEIFYHPPLLH